MDANLFDRFATNGLPLMFGKGASLLRALAHFGLSGIAAEEKAFWRKRIIDGRPYTEADAAGILAYCKTDVDALAVLVPRLAEALGIRPYWPEHALHRGRYIKSVAWIEHTGVPIDLPVYRKLTDRWDWIKTRLIDHLRDEYPIWEGSTLKYDRLEAWLRAQRIPWPRTETGRLSLSDDTFKTMSRAFPVVAPIREVRENLAKLRLSDLAVGRDGRNRASVFPFGTRSSRNAPSNSRFIFGPSAWLRSLIRPLPAMAIAYVDYASQEIAVAAALSGDIALKEAYTSGDPYLAFAVAAGLAPADATRTTHKTVRDQCKAVVLGTLYGMQYQTLAGQLDMPTLEAKQLLATHRRVYARFWAWAQAAVDHAMLYGYMDTTFGWRLHVTSETRVTSLLNYPMQANAAEMLRLACIFATEAGVRVCAPVHDALLIEALVSEIDQAVALTRQCMTRAGRIVLDGFEVRTDAEVIRYPARYQDQRGVRMWELATELAAESVAA